MEARQGRQSQCRKKGLLFRAEPYMESIKHGLQTLILIRERSIWLSLSPQA